MKKIIVFTLMIALLVSVSSLVSAESDDLTEGEKKYLNKKVTVKRDVPYMIMLSSSPNYSWKVYRDGETLPPEKFLEIAGYPEKAEEEVNLDKRRNLYIYGGLGVTLASEIIFSDDQFTLSVATLLGGAAILYRGLSLPKNKINVEEAKAIAEKYNSKLKLKYGVDTSISNNNKYVLFSYNF